MPSVTPEFEDGRHKVSAHNFLVRAKLRKMGLSATDADVLEIRRRIDAKLGSLKTYPIWLTDQEVEEICRSVAGPSRA